MLNVSGGYAVGLMIHHVVVLCVSRSRAEEAARHRSIFRRKRSERERSRFVAIRYNCTYVECAAQSLKYREADVHTASSCYHVFRSLSVTSTALLYEYLLNINYYPFTC